MICFFAHLDSLALNTVYFVLEMVILSWKSPRNVLENKVSLAVGTIYIFSRIINLGNRNIPTGLLGIITCNTFLITMYNSV